MGIRIGVGFLTAGNSDESGATARRSDEVVLFLSPAVFHSVLVDGESNSSIIVLDRLRSLA